MASNETFTGVLRFGPDTSNSFNNDMYVVTSDAYVVTSDAVWRLRPNHLPEKLYAKT